MQQINIVGPRNVVAACLKTGVKRLVHFSSIHALSTQPKDGVVDETRGPSGDDGAPDYDCTKAAGEHEVQAGVKQGLDAVVLNPTGVIGPGDYRPSPMGAVFLKLYHRQIPSLIDGGFNWVDVRDVVSGALAAAERGRTGERYLLSGHWLSVRELAVLVEKETGRGPPWLVAPMWSARLAAPFAVAWAHLTNGRPLFTSASLHALRNHRQISHDKASRDLGYQPRPVEETVRDIFRWFADAKQL
jgi:dihydroflavonol-4-reductase